MQVHLKNANLTLNTLGGLPYNVSKVKLCYSTPYSANRAWRTASPIISVSQHLDADRYMPPVYCFTAYTSRN